MAFISRECSFYLNYNNSPEFLHYQSLSGIGFNKLGFYEQCIADPKNQFYLVEGISKLFGGQDDEAQVFMSGICFNSVCTAEDLEYAMGSLQQYIKLPFKLLDVQTPSLIEQSFNYYNITVLVLLAILILFFLVCSTIDVLKRLKKINYDTKYIEIFSVLTTFRLLESRSQRNNQRIKIFSGLKFLCLIGIMLTNIGIVVYNAPTTSKYGETQNGSIFLSFYGFDIWLLVSGFFLSFLLLRQYAKLRSAKILLLKILRRFFRLWPIYILSLLLNWNIVHLIGSGPLWPLLMDYPKKNNCLGPHHLFMFSNFVDNKCYNWLWLFQLDFQLCFLFVPMLLLYINRQKKYYKYLFYSLQGILLLCSISLCFILKDTDQRNITDYFFHVEYSMWNILPVTRCAGFIIGYNLGIVFYHFKKEPEKKDFWLIKILEKKRNRTLLVLFGLVGLGVIIYFFGTFAALSLEDYHILYFESLHILVPLLVSFVIVPSLFGYYSPMKKILQSWVCNLISKLSISIYAAHFIITLFIIYYRQYDMGLSSFTMIYLTFCTILPTIVISIVLTTIVEIPVFVCKKVFWKTESITYFEH